MPYYSVIAEVIVTRAYSVHADSQSEAESAVKDEFAVMEYDILEETIDTLNTQELD